MRRISILFSVGLFLFVFLDAMGEEQVFPSNYIGIFDRFGNFENGKIPFKGTPYTGRWEYKNKDNNEYLCGYYKQGIPFGTWILYYPSGIPFQLCAYDKDNFVSTSYYPDGMPELSSYGKTQMTKDSFSHVQQNVYHWNPAGIKIVNTPKDRFTKSGVGWYWGENEIIMPSKSRDAIVNNVNVFIVTFLNNSDFMMLAIYFYTSDTFLKKVLIEAEINHQEGTIEICKQTSSGITDSIAYEIVIVNAPVDNSTHVKETGFDVKLQSPKKDVQIIPVRIRIEFTPRTI